MVGGKKRSRRQVTTYDKDNQFNLQGLSWKIRNRHGIVVNLLLTVGVRPDVEDCDGQTRLSCTAEFGHLEAVRCF